ncbi:hypothetical protein BAE44_0002857 [Dichanthelium oligosanthes]|uniref:No apical meristem-associated C-terminal domain-containing protein n=1 Tax=Dichanthelium oligosanthes TaxID=888268 RepID=A0A1E5WFK3_9POAL|nr:hypothetical protein BAE44_0002857 [Dichanthelium oligosanthes]
MKCSDYPTRTLQSLGGRWDFIKEQVSKFARHHRQILLEHRSGDAPCDEVAAGIVRYNSLEKRPFAMAHCWAVLKKKPKWLNLLETRIAGDSTAQAVDDTSEGGAEGTESHDSESSRGTKRPMGRDAAKASRKRGSTTSYTQSSEYVSKMSDMCLQRTSFWKDSDDRANERLDKLMEIEAEHLEIE